MGNPPFVGKHLMTQDQESDMEFVWRDAKGAGVLDYVTCWYKRAAEYIAGTTIPVAFVSTNSITQGEQVAALWSELFGRWNLKIRFAHRTFAWISEARGKAHVHVVIIGFGASSSESKRLYDYDSADGHVTVSEPANISPYLLEGSDTFVSSRSKPLGDAPEIRYGNKPADGGYLLIEDDDLESFRASNPSAMPYVRRIICADEYLNGEDRWALWLIDAPPQVIRENTDVRQRVEGVREFRKASTKIPTQKRADYPALFAEIRQPSSRYILVPRHSSERRKYVPFCYFEPDVIIGDSCTAIPDATLYDFGLISSVMHVAWLRVVCGRIKSDFRYSNRLVYNNFPWPTDVTDKQKAAVEAAAQAVLDAREPFLPPQGDSTLADLYDPLTMPAVLAKAHAALDRAVDRCYRPAAFQSDRERVEHLFALYEKLTAPLLPATKRSRKRAR